MKKTAASLLIGNLWNINEVKLQKLRDNNILPTTALATLKTESVTQKQIIAPEVKLQANVISNISTVTTAAIIPTTPINQDIQAIQTPRSIALPQNPATPANEIKAPVTSEVFINHDWSSLISEIKSCEKCPLNYGRTQVVIERGNRQADWMFIGEGPGEHEDSQGLPFVGVSGQLLDKMIAAMKLDCEQDVYIANVVKCRPPHNRNPEASEVAACRNYLINQINLVQPKIIITLGRFAAQTLLATELAIGKLRGQVHAYENIPLIVTYHPSYLLRTPSAKKAAWEDLQLAMQIYNGL